jgi:signal transduction histidine kinase
VAGYRDRLEPEAGKAIFTPFEQASREVTREFGGLGLGLAISKAALDAHNGTLTAESAGPNLGATFRVELPLLTAAPEVDLASSALAGAKQL